MKNVYTDKKGYFRFINSDELFHRYLANKYIYKPNRNNFDLPFGWYVVHHIDGNKKNNKLSNLQIITQEEHDTIHGIVNEPMFKHPKHPSSIPAYTHLPHSDSCITPTPNYKESNNVLGWITGIIVFIAILITLIKLVGWEVLLFLLFLFLMIISRVRRYY